MWCTSYGCFIVISPILTTNGLHTSDIVDGIQGPDWTTQDPDFESSDRGPQKLVTTALDTGFFRLRKPKTFYLTDWYFYISEFGTNSEQTYISANTLNFLPRRSVATRWTDTSNHRTWSEVEWGWQHFVCTICVYSNLESSTQSKFVWHQQTRPNLARPSKALPGLQGLPYLAVPCWQILFLASARDPCKQHIDLARPQDLAKPC